MRETPPLPSEAAVQTVMHAIILSIVAAGAMTEFADARAVAANAGLTEQPAAVRSIVVVGATTDTAGARPAAANAGKPD